MLREIVLDTETTGLDFRNGDRLIEVGCVEIVNRIPTGREFHSYICPEDREVHPEAEQVHGLSTAFLKDKPLFKAVADTFIAFVADAPLVIHNAAFDIGFINMELDRAGRPPIPQERLVDTLALARRKHPAGPNSLDALCKRYGVDNSGRDLHGALLDARILADVYLAMSGGQAALRLESEPAAAGPAREASRRLARGDVRIPVVLANADEIAAHEQLLDGIERTSGGRALFRAGDRANGKH